MSDPEKQTPTPVDMAANPGIPEGREIPFAELLENDMHLRVGDAITGLDSPADLNALDQHMARNIFHAPLPAHHEVVKDPLSRALKPKGFHGDIIDSTALVIPAPSQGRYASHGPGTRLLIAGSLKSSGRGVIGDFIRPVTYRLGPGAGGNLYGQTAGGSVLVRKVGANMNAKELSGIIEAVKDESVAKAMLVSRLAVKHAYAAGLPGHGKRR